MPETDNTSPENLIPKAKKGSELWKWLKEVLQKAADKLKDRNSTDDDPDKKDAKKVLKNVKKISERIAQEKQEAIAAGTTADHEELDKYFPPAIRDMLEDINLEDFIDKYAYRIIPRLAEVTKDLISVDAGIVEVGYIIAHEMGVDKALARKLAPKIRTHVESALRRMNMAAKKDEYHIGRGEEAMQEINKLTQEENPQDPAHKEQRRSREEENGEEGFSAYGDEGRLAARLQGRMSDKDYEWFIAMTNPLRFSELFDRRVQKLMQEGKNGKTYNEAEAQTAVSDEATEFVMNALITIYSPILDEDPKEFFEKQAQNAGSYNDNPFNAAQTFSKMLNALRERSEIASQKAGDTDVNPFLSNKYRRLERKTLVVHDDSSGQLVERTLPSTSKSEVRIGEFAEYLREVFETGSDTIDYGHNFKLLTTLGPREGPRGVDPFFSQIRGLAKRFTADKIDTAFRLPYNDVVQAAKQKFQSSYARMFVDFQWQKDPSLLGKFLHSMPAAERRVKDELREQFKGEDIPDWALEWAFQSGRTMYFGLDFGFHEMMSYADPNLQYNGDASLTGLEGMQGYFDMWEGAKMLNFKKDLILAGAVWMPYSVNMGDHTYDHAKWRKEGEGKWKQSFTMGQAAFAGSFLDGERLFIDMGNYLHTGGWGTNQGWRVREGYNTWLLDEFKGSVLNKLEPKAADPDLYVRAWKRIENIGIPIAENFWQQQVMEKVDNDSESKQKPELVSAVKSLGGFFYDRYFSDGNGNLTSVGRQLLSKYPSKHDFIHELEHIMTDKHYNGSRHEALQTIINNVSTVLTLEQMPAHFVTMEKQRMTEYGVTLLSEIQESFVPNASQATAQERVDGKKRVDTALANLVYVQEQLRIQSSKSMDESLKTHDNLYGDLSSLRSNILNGQGNILTQEYIVKVLENRYNLQPGEGSTNKQVQDVVHLYKTIHQKITAPPTLTEVRRNSAINKLFIDAQVARAKSKKEQSPNDLEVIKRVEAIEEKANTQQFRSRIAWWSHALDSNYFGHSVTQPSVAMKYINVSAGGPDVVARDAGQAANTAELMHTQAQTLYREGLKVGAEAGHEKGIHAGYGPLEEWIGSFKGKVQGELGSPPAYEMSFRMAQLIDYFFKKDDAAKTFLGEKSYWAKFKKRSFSDALIDEGAPLMAWDTDAEYGWAHYLHHHGKLKMKAAKGEKHRVIYKDRAVKKILDKIPFIGKKLGDRIKGYEFHAHDNANTFSEHGLIGWADAGYSKLFKQKWLPAIILMLIGLGILSAKQGMKDIEIA